MWNNTCERIKTNWNTKSSPHIAMALHICTWCSQIFSHAILWKKQKRVGMRWHCHKFCMPYHGMVNSNCCKLIFCCWIYMQCVQSKEKKDTCVMHNNKLYAEHVYIFEPHSIYVYGRLRQIFIWVYLFLVAHSPTINSKKFMRNFTVNSSSTPWKFVTLNVEWPTRFKVRNFNDLNNYF